MHNSSSLHAPQPAQRPMDSIWEVWNHLHAPSGKTLITSLIRELLPIICDMLMFAFVSPLNMCFHVNWLLGIDNYMWSVPKNSWWLTLYSNLLVYVTSCWVKQFGFDSLEPKIMLLKNENCTMKGRSIEVLRWNNPDPCSWMLMSEAFVFESQKSLKSPWTDPTCKKVVELQFPQLLQGFNLVSASMNSPFHNFNSIVATDISSIGLLHIQPASIALHYPVDRELWFDCE